MIHRWPGSVYHNIRPAREAKKERAGACAGLTVIGLRIPELGLGKSLH